MPLYRFMYSAIERFKCLKDTYSKNLLHQPAPCESPMQNKITPALLIGMFIMNIAHYYVIVLFQLQGCPIHFSTLLWYPRFRPCATNRLKMLSKQVAMSVTISLVYLSRIESRARIHSRHSALELIWWGTTMNSDLSLKTVLHKCRRITKINHGSIYSDSCIYLQMSRQSMKCSSNSSYLSEGPRVGKSYTKAIANPVFLINTRLALAFMQGFQLELIIHSNYRSGEYTNSLGRMGQHSKFLILTTIYLWNDKKNRDAVCSIQ